MRLVLDDEELTGPQTLLVSIRPPRRARLFPADDMAHLLAAIELNCQLWGGAASPTVPLNSARRIDDLYRDQILGAAVDRIEGIFLPEFDPEAALESSWPEAQFRDELALTFLDPNRKDSYRPITVTVLNKDDPWRPMYAACLGYLPETPDKKLLHEANLIPDLTFEHFIRVNRVEVQGSIDDLWLRVNDPNILHPRAAAMFELAYGLEPTTSIRRSSSNLPASGFDAFDAGPNIVVVCTPGDASDIALLWNLRCAHGDGYGVPIGVLSDELPIEFLNSLPFSEGIARQGIGQHSMYLTSASISADQLRERLPQTDTWNANLKTVEATALARFGPAPARPRGEVSVWADGRSTVIPASSEDRATLFKRQNAFRDLDLQVDVQVLDSPFPNANDVRADTFSERFFAGRLTKVVGRSATEGVTVRWPSRLLMLKAVAQARGLKVSSSEPGLACLTLLESFEDPTELQWISHAPLLALLQDMANRQGTAWAKAHMRGDPADAPDITNQIAPSEDDLPELAFGRFHSALGSDKAARYWLEWAESRRIIVKGFPLQCESCRAKQWIPVAGFSPPLTCQGCARTIDRPFPAELVKFKYRLGESIRRVFEHDAIGHLLTLRYFVFVFQAFRSSLMIGGHPGLNTDPLGGGQQIGEADVLILLTDGACVPIEVKRSFAGVSPNELVKLRKLADAWKAPWSAVAVTDYARSAPSNFSELEERGEMFDHYRLLLTFDQLLDPHPKRSMGGDPFEWSPMSAEDIAEREKSFTNSVVNFFENRSESSFETSLLYRPKPKQPESE